VAVLPSVLLQTRCMKTRCLLPKFSIEKTSIGKHIIRKSFVQTLASCWNIKKSWWENWDAEKSTKEVEVLSSSSELWDLLSLYYPFLTSMHFVFLSPTYRIISCRYKYQSPYKLLQEKSAKTKFPFWGLQSSGTPSFPVPNWRK
jgi:hypothetical protein